MGLQVIRARVMTSLPCQPSLECVSNAISQDTGLMHASLEAVSLVAVSMEAKEEEASLGAVVFKAIATTVERKATERTTVGS